MGRDVHWLFERGGIAPAKNHFREIDVTPDFTQDEEPRTAHWMSKLEWSEGPKWPELDATALHVWLAHLPSTRLHLDYFTGLLAADELERAARFRLGEHLERWKMARGILRILLARYVKANPASLSLTYGEHGKPLLPDNDVHFNTSHSGDYAMFAFTRAGMVGVDVERIHEQMGRREEIARKYFAPGEQQQWLALPDSERVRGFFAFWTRKEAFVKARGDGVFSGLDQFETSLHEPRVLSVRGQPVTDWWMSDLPNIPGYSASVAVNTVSCTPHFWQWSNDFLK